MIKFVRRNIFMERQLWHDALTRMEQPRKATLQLLALGPVSANGPKDVSKKETSHRA